MRLSTPPELPNRKTGRHNLPPNMAAPFIVRSSGMWNLDRDRKLFCRGLSCTWPRNKGTSMKKSLLALAAVATLAVSMASPAYAWRGGWGPGIGLGILGGAIIGGAIASSNPYYYGPGYAPGYYYGPGYDGGPYGPCYWQRQRFWDGYAWRARNVRVCE